MVMGIRRVWTGSSLFGQTWSKNQNCLFKMKFGTYFNSSMLNFMVIFNFFHFNWKYAFWTNLVQKDKTVWIRWNMIPKLIQICWIRYQCSFALFFNRKYHFFAYFVHKIKIVYTNYYGVWQKNRKKKRIEYIWRVVAQQCIPVKKRCLRV